MVGRENVYFLAFEENRFILDAMDLIPAENVIPIRTGGIAGTLTRTLALPRMEAHPHRRAAQPRERGRRPREELEIDHRVDPVPTHRADGGEGPYRGNLLTHRLRYNPHLHTSTIMRKVFDVCRWGL